MAALTPVTETMANVEEVERVTDEGKICFYDLNSCSNVERYFDIFVDVSIHS